MMKTITISTVPTATTASERRSQRNATACCQKPLDEGDDARGNVVDSTDDLYSARFDRFGDDLRERGNCFDVERDVLRDRVFEPVAVQAARCTHSRHRRIDETLDVAALPHSVAHKSESGSDRTTARMPEDHDEGYF